MGPVELFQLRSLRQGDRLTAYVVRQSNPVTGAAVPQHPRPSAAPVPPSVDGNFAGETTRSVATPIGTASSAASTSSSPSPSPSLSPPVVITDASGLNRSVLALSTNYAGNNDAGTLLLSDTSVSGIPELIFQRTGNALLGAAGAIQFQSRNGSGVLGNYAYLDSGWEIGNTGAEYSDHEFGVYVNGVIAGLQIGLPPVTADAPAIYGAPGEWRSGVDTARWAESYQQAVYYNAVFKTANYTMDSGATHDFHVLADSASGNVTITLPTAPHAGRTVVVTKNSAANTVTVAPGGADVLQLPVGVSAAMTAIFKSLMLLYNGGGLWLYLGGYN